MPDPAGLHARRGAHWTFNGAKFVQVNYTSHIIKDRRKGALSFFTNPQTPLTTLLSTTGPDPGEGDGGRAFPVVRPPRWRSGRE